MNETPTQTKQARKKRSNPVLKVLAALLIAAACAFFYLWGKGDIQPAKIPSQIQDCIERATSGSGKQEDRPVASSTNTKKTGPAAEDETGPSSQFESLDSGDSTQTDADKLAASPGQNGEVAKPADEPAAGTPAGEEQSKSDEQLAGSRITEINAFYTHLDQQQYMKQFNLPEPSKPYFSKLIQKLLDNPPVVARETDDLFTLLKNTAHFFRVLGKENIIVLKGILDREKNSFEEILQTFYALTDQPEYLKKEYGIVIPDGALHDYAGFFLNTMGGRLYLFRRDSVSRLAVSYYSILIVDKAISNGNGYYGIDLRPAIDSLIEELENGGDRLRLRQTYLDKLYDLQQKYAR